VTDVARTEWVAGFGTELRHVMPLLSIVAAHQKGVAAYERSPEVEPEEAARLCAAEPPLPRVEGTFELRQPPTAAEARWVQRFARHLKKLQRSLRGRNAMVAARNTYPDASDLEPEEAATIYASAPVPRSVGAPGG
jgi:hypothetical protein